MQAPYTPVPQPATPEIYQPFLTGEPTAYAIPESAGARLPYFNEIQSALEQYPDVQGSIQEAGYDSYAFILALIQVESSGNPKAVNPESGATGLMQLMPMHFEEDQDPTDITWNITRGMQDLHDKLVIAEGNLRNAMLNYSGGGVWESEEAFDERYWQPLMQEYQKIAPKEMAMRPPGLARPPGEEPPEPSAWERLLGLPERAPELVGEIPGLVGRFLNALSPGFTQRTKVRLADPLREIGRIVTSREALADEAATLLGEIQADQTIWPKLGGPPTEMRLPDLLKRTVMGAYGTWFDFWFTGVFKRGDDLKNALMGTWFRDIERKPATWTAALTMGKGAGYWPLTNPETLEKVTQEMTTTTSLSGEDLRAAIEEVDVVWSLAAMEPTFREDLREKVRTGELTWEDVMRDYRNDNMELVMNLATSP